MNSVFLQKQCDALLNSYWVIDVWPDGTIFDMNQHMEDISWYSLSEIKWKNMNIMSSWSHTRDFWKPIFETINFWFQWQGEIINKKKDGTLQWLETIIIPLFDNKGFRFFRVCKTVIFQRYKNARGRSPQFSYDEIIYYEAAHSETNAYGLCRKGYQKESL